MPQIKRIEGTTRELGKPPDWDEKSNPCNTLPIRDVVTPDGPFMISAWEFTNDEVKRLIDGETLKLWIRGTSHPVVCLTVGDIVE